MTHSIGSRIRTRSTVRPSRLRIVDLLIAVAVGWSVVIIAWTEPPTRKAVPEHASPAMLANASNASSAAETFAARTSATPPTPFVASR